MCKDEWQGEIPYGQGTAPSGPQALSILLRNASRKGVLEAWGLTPAPQPGSDPWFTLLAGKAFPVRALPFACRHSCCHLIQHRAGTQSCRRRGPWCSSKPTLGTSSLEGGKRGACRAEGSQGQRLPWSTGAFTNASPLSNRGAHLGLCYQGEKPKHRLAPPTLGCSLVCSRSMLSCLNSADRRSRG